MKYCLWCHNRLMLEINWETVLSLPKQNTLCLHCFHQLDYLSKEQCRYCSRLSEDTECYDCKRWKEFYNHSDPLDRNISVFTYNEFIKEVITKWKYRGDFILGDIFKEKFIQQFNYTFLQEKKSEMVSVPIPLSTKRQKERGFNQAHVLAEFLPVQSLQILERIHNEKQSKKSKKQRMSTVNPFILSQPINKPVVLVDDIYTTGRTVRHAAELLKANGCPKVYSYTLIRG